MVKRVIHIGANKITKIVTKGYPVLESLSTNELMNSVEVAPSNIPKHAMHGAYKQIRFTEEGERRGGRRVGRETTF